MERHQLISHLAELIDEGRVKVYSVDSVAGQAMVAREGSSEHRMWLFNQFHETVAAEVVPAIHADCGGTPEIVAAGASIGAFNALASVCRYPHLFRAAVCMSGTYHVEQFLDSFNEDLYFASPVHFVPGLDGVVLEALRRRFLILASGSGRWEDVGGRKGLGGEGDPEPGGRLGPGLRPRLAHLVGDVAGLPARARGMTDTARPDTTRPDAALADAVAGLMPQAREGLARLVAIRSVADPEVEPAAECVRAAEEVLRLFAEVGIEGLGAVETADGSLAVIGHSPGPVGAPTVLLYSHYDVQPTGDPAGWTTDPWTLSERDGRWYGRGAADCKGNLVMHLTALRALRQVDGTWPVGITVVCEGSEEVSSGGLEALVRSDPELFAADVMVVADSGNVELGLPTVTTSLRGTGSVLVSVPTLEGPVHSGAFGGAAPDALAALIHVLSTLRDADGETTVDGLESSNRWQGSAYPVDRFRKDAGVLDGVDVLGRDTIADSLWARPVANVLAILRALGTLPTFRTQVLPSPGAGSPPGLRNT